VYACAKRREREPFVLSRTLRAAKSRLAGIADWTTQPHRDAANYPPDTSPYSGRDGEGGGWDSPRKPIIQPIQVTLARGTHSRSRTSFPS